MTNQWFGIPNTPDGDNPEHVVDNKLSWTGNYIGNSDRWVVRVYGTQQELDDLESNPSVNPPTMTAVENAFSDVTDVTTTSFNQSFHIGDSNV